jgi:malto-oligosyltrehalose synthase
MFLHSSTYRIQFNHRFTFTDLEKHLDYLSLLGVGKIYASPIFQSTPGSTHGYDVTDPSVTDPELGGEDDLIKLNKELKNRQIGWLQDIVPNHMAFNRFNTWLWDVLEKGKDSEYARIFDIDWEHPGFDGKLMVPFLGKSLDEILRDGDLQIVFHGGSFYFKYFDEEYPINLSGFQAILKRKQTQLPDHYLNFLGVAGSGESPEDPSTGVPAWEKIKERFKQDYESSTVIQNLIDGILEEINKDNSILLSIHDLQHYRLCHWKLTEKMINYRRFFTVNGLICLRMEDPWVYELYHTYLQYLSERIKLEGIRVDHIDGLRDPDRYLSRLRQMSGKDTYITIEKILEINEELPDRWDIQGTTGYEFMAHVNNLFTNTHHYPALIRLYRDITGIEKNIEEIIYEKKKIILLDRMSGELENLIRELLSSELIPDIRLMDTDQGRMGEAIAEFLVACPVYRLYSTSIPLEKENGLMINHIFDIALSRNPALKKEFNILSDLFMDQYGLGKDKNERVLHFFNRCMQFTGPLMAKGVEDTTMYYFNQFIAHNEVGDFPASAGISSEEFHKLMIQRQERWPQTMNATSTHDTKRGEDVRARLNVISDLGPGWIDLVRKWRKMNKGLKQNIRGSVVPDANEEYLIYQTLTGVWPMEKKPDNFIDRLDEYFIKALREAKVHTAWSDPAEEYEKAVVNFVRGIIHPDSEFYRSFTEFHQKINKYGILNQDEYSPGQN